MKQHKKAFVIWLALVVLLGALALLVGPPGAHQDVKVAMRDAVLHDVNRVSLFGLKDVNPGLISALCVSGSLLVIALILRVFVIPRFRIIPGKLQLLLETAVSFFDDLTGNHDAGKCTFAGAYVFSAGLYIFTSTLFELLGLQAVAVSGHSVALPAPLSDVNAAIAMGCGSYLAIMLSGILGAGLHGVGATLKEFSLPISMSFRLFGALLSGLLVTELVYHYAALSYGLPVIVGVMFTLLHAIIQTYVLTMLVGMYSHEVAEKPPKKERTVKKHRLAAKRV